MSNKLKTIDLPAIHLPSIDRKSIRRLIDDNSEYLGKELECGRDIDKASSDWVDQIFMFSMTLSEVDRALFMDIYLEESRLSTESLKDATDKVKRDRDSAAKLYGLKRKKSKDAFKRSLKDASDEIERKKNNDAVWNIRLPKVITLIATAIIIVSIILIVI